MKGYKQSNNTNEKVPNKHQWKTEYHYIQYRLIKVGETPHLFVTRSKWGHQSWSQARIKEESWGVAIPVKFSLVSIWGQEIKTIQQWRGLIRNLNVAGQGQQCLQ